MSRLARIVGAEITVRLVLPLLMVVAPRFALSLIRGAVHEAESR